MDHDFFVRLAKDRQCRCQAAAASIRSHAIKKDNDSENRADANLLPTLSTLRAARPIQDDHLVKPASGGEDNANAGGAFSTDQINWLLRCDCKGVCGPRTKRIPPHEDGRSARRIYNDDNLLRLFAVLCLSGCLFAIRPLVDNGIHSPEASVEIIRNTGNYGLREDLLQAFARSDQQCPHQGSHGTGQYMLCLGTVFCDCLRHKGWLLRIPSFSRSTQLPSFELRQNMPFHDESEPRKPRDDRRFIKCKFAPGHCGTDLRELQDVYLFRKRMRFDPLRQGMQAEPREEASVLSVINDMKHENIAELLFMFQELRPDYTYLTLVFRWHESDLEAIFDGRSSADVFELATPDQPSDGSISIKDHGLWRSMLGIIDAIKVIHAPQNNNIRLREDENMIGGHFDIKPANILVTERGQLLLTDFGQAHLKRRRAGQDTNLTARPGTRNYAPPPNATNRMNRSYDVWSLACVLLETLCFLAYGGPSAVSQFYRERFGESTGDQSAAFWKTGAGERPVLRQAVVNKLQQLSGDLEPTMGDVVTEVRDMLCIEERSRPKISASLRKFRGEGQLDISMFVPTAQREVLKGRLEEMLTSVSTARIPNLVSCRLFLWRNLEVSADHEELMLIISAAGAGSYAEKTMLQNEMFVPVSCFDENTAFSNRTQPDRTTKCRFRTLHSATTLHFHNARNFIDFQASVTHQLVLSAESVPSLQGARLKFTSCNVELHRLVGSKPLKFSSGRVQIWRRLTDEEYRKRFFNDNEGLSRVTTLANGISNVQHDDGGTEPRATRIRRSHPAFTCLIKLAIFIFDPQQRRCMIMHLDRSDCVIEFPNTDLNKVVLKRPVAGDHQSFSLSLLSTGGCGQSQNSANEYPGIPMSPTVLDRAIKQGVKVKRLTLEMESAQSRTYFQEIYNSAVRSP